MAYIWNRVIVDTIHPFNSDVICGKALKYVSFVLSNEFSQIANIEPKLTTYWHKMGEQLRNKQCINDKAGGETAITMLFRK